MHDTRVVVYSHAGTIDRAEWCRLCANLDARLDPRWFLLNDAEIAPESRYVAVWRQDRLSTLAPCLVAPAGGDGFVPHRATDILFSPERIHGSGLRIDRRLLTASRQSLLTESLFPSLAVATPCSAFAPVNDLVCGSANDIVDFQLAVTAIEQLAATMSARLWAILGVPAGSPLLERAADFGFLPALIAADTIMSVRWESFEDYLGCLGSRRRYSIRWELARTRENEVEIAIAPDAQTIVDDQVRVTLSHLASLGEIGDAETETWYLRETIRRFGPDYSVLCARRRSELIGVCSVLSNGRTHKVLDCYVDPARTARGNYLFPALMSAVIEHIIARGGGTVTFGPTNYQAKLHRGCSLQPLWGLYKPLDPSLRQHLADYLAIYNRLQSDCFEPLLAFENQPRG